MESATYLELDKQWKSACRTILGGEVGPLDDYREWLSGLNDPLAIRKTPSGQSVVMTSGSYCK
ncbi:MAG TPA: hypothetical protein PLO51_02125 [Candidatus Micrarchaeota archaeon]|nr:hypothetical protein [Candidatus Micrarchaeota archaeon]